MVSMFNRHGFTIQIPHAVTLTFDTLKCETNLLHWHRVSYCTTLVNMASCLGSSECPDIVKSYCADKVLRFIWDFNPMSKSFYHNLQWNHKTLEWTSTGQHHLILKESSFCSPICTLNKANRFQWSVDHNKRGYFKMLPFDTNSNRHMKQFALRRWNKLSED